MAIAGFNRETFEERLRERLSPTQPIRTPEYLRGRERKLEEIRRAFVAPGRHIFIHGDRGVGKTSLAQTAAYEHQSSDQGPIILTCDPASGFYQIARDLASSLIGQDPTTTKTTVTKKGTFGFLSNFSAEAQKAIESGQVPELQSINQVASILTFASQRHSKAPVAVIDEFERVKSGEERMLFADMIKQLGDQSINLKLIFCGVGSSLNELLDAHHSCYRYLSVLELERLGYDGRFAIIDSTFQAFRVEIDETTRFRIAKISDGFPHFVHAICEKLLWEIFEDPRTLNRIGPAHYTAAIDAAVTAIEPHLRQIYEHATKKYNDDYEEVLWAVADDKELSRRSTDIFNSYLRIMKLRDGRTALPREKFNQRMNSLKKPSAKEILKGSRSGWYEFSENIVRGYVRLRAAQQGIELEVDHPLMARRFAPAIDNSR
jgi:AAA+ ATPase superfamily predicted ATPase